MYSKIILNLILIVGLVVIQLSFISGLPIWFKNFNLIIITLIFILGLGSLKLALWWAMGAGILLDIYSFAPFGVYLISLLFMVLFINFLLANFFTNRSLYSFLALTFFAFISYKLLLYSIGGLINFVSRQEAILSLSVNFWIHELNQLIVNFLAVLLVFYLLSFASSKLKPVFLFKRK